MNKKKYYQNRKNRKDRRYELPNNHRKWIGFKRGYNMDNQEEISVEKAVFERMTTEKGTYGFEDICRLEAEEIWNRTFSHKIKYGIKCPMSDDYFYGFLAACKYLNERKKTIEENEQSIESLQNLQT